jgi:hypothetical protein
MGVSFMVLHRWVVLLQPSREDGFQYDRETVRLSGPPQITVPDRESVWAASVTLTSALTSVRATHAPRPNCSNCLSCSIAAERWSSTGSLLVVR